jgi:outer membrane protein TolC
LAVQQASLAAAEDGARALENLRIPTFLARELPVRRKQAALGVAAAAAGLDQVEHETVYAVTRTYFTVVYAREQERVARSVVERLSATHDTAARMLKAGAREVTANDVDRTLVYLNLAEARQTQAAEGIERALAALKEAIGVGPNFCLQVPPGRLPEPELRICRNDIITLALARRGELVQASTFSEVAGLEVEAQRTSLRHQMGTFAAGGDIHARQVPQGLRNMEYRPEAVPPEMPTTLAGSRTERMQRARSFSARAEAVAEKTRNLIALEAEDAFLRWEEASRKVQSARKAADTGDKLADSLSKDFVSGLKVRVDEVVSAKVLASQARAQYNEYLYQQILALADLERVTAGGFCAGLTTTALAQPPQENGRPETTNGGR